MTMVARSGNWVRVAFEQREASVALTILALVIFLGLANGFFLTLRNLLNGGRQASVVALVALGQALVVVARGLDLSVGAVLGLFGVARNLGDRELLRRLRRRALCRRPRPRRDDGGEHSVPRLRIAGSEWHEGGSGSWLTSMAKN